MRESLIHAADLAMLGDWDGAKRAVEPFDDDLANRLHMLFTQQQEQAVQRAERLAVVRHELGNALSIAQANIEAMADGVLAVTPERLNSIRDALRNAGAYLTETTREPKELRGDARTEDTVDVRALLEHETEMVGPFASAKRVTIVFDESASRAMLSTGSLVSNAMLVREALLDAIRASNPGERIAVHCDNTRGGITIRIARQSGDERSILLKLRAGAVSE